MAVFTYKLYGVCLSYHSTNEEIEVCSHMITVTLRNAITLSLTREGRPHGAIVQGFRVNEGLGCVLFPAVLPQKTRNLAQKPCTLQPRGNVTNEDSSIGERYCYGTTNAPTLQGKKRQRVAAVLSFPKT